MKNGWPRKALGEVCQFRGGGTPSKSVERYWRGDIPWVSPKDVKSAIVSDSIDHISQEAIDGSATSLIPKDSVLMVVRSGILARTVPIAIAGRDLTINQDLKALCPNGVVHSRFLYYLLKSKMDVLLSMVSRGATVHRLKTDQIRSLDFILPPLAEQQRIIGVLDEAFAGLATAQAHAEKNLQNARALFESHLQSVFTQRGKGWVERNLRDVCEKITDGTHQTPKYLDDGVVFLSSRNVTRGTIDWDHVKYIDTKQHIEMHKRVAPRRDDILLAKNGTTGVGAIVDRDTIFDIYVSLAHLRALPTVRPRFLLHFINSPVAKIQFNKRLKGIGVPNLHLEEIREVRIPFPSDVEEQDLVISKLDTLSAETQRLEILYQQKQTALLALKKSLLHQAFSGAL